MFEFRRSKDEGDVPEVNLNRVDGDVSPVLAIPKVEDTSQVQPWRVFINHIGSYHARRLTDLLSQRLYIPSEFKNERRVSSNKIEQPNEGYDDAIDEENPAVYQSITRDSKNESRSESQRDKAPRKFELIGTAFPDSEKYSKDFKIIPSFEENREKFLAEISQCGFIIYDITQDATQISEATCVYNELVQISNGSELNERRFILISSLMTWAATKVNHSKPLTESNFRKRKAHANFKEHIECEHNIVRKLSNQLQSLIIFAGLTYGEEQADLFYAFKLAWSNEPNLPVIGKGENLIPLLHVRDLASAVYAIMKRWPVLRYIVAAEKEPITQRTLMETIGGKLSTGKVKSITAKQAELLYPDMTPRVLDVITVDLDIRPVYLLKSDSQMEWMEPNANFCTRIDRLDEDFRAAWNLQPIRLIVLGPPASGKTMFARELARHYRIHYLAFKRLISDTIEQLGNQIRDLKEMQAEITEKNEESEITKEDKIAMDLEKYEHFLNEIHDGINENNGKLRDDTLTKIMWYKLRSKECQNQGYVIDGYPKTLEQAKMLFGEADNLEDYEEEDPVSTLTSRVSEEKPEETNTFMPHHVIVLDAKDNFLMERVINLPEKEVSNTHYSEENMLTQLQYYRENNTEDNTPLQVFDDLEIYPIIFDIEKDESPQMLSTFHQCLNLIGSPRNFGPTADEIEELKKQLELDAAQAAEERERYFAERRQEREKRALEWTSLLEKLKEEEEERLYLQTEPLRDYLGKYVFPTLTEGLLEVAKLRPDEPIDYLAEYLLKKNPNGRPGEPDYNEEMSTTLSLIQQLQADGILPASSSFDANAYEHSNIFNEFMPSSRGSSRNSEGSIVHASEEIACSRNGSDEEKEATCGCYAYDQCSEFG